MPTSCAVAVDTKQHQSAVALRSETEQTAYDDPMTLSAARVLRLIFLFCLCALFFMFFY
jgi:hypothetical protein